MATGSSDEAMSPQENNESRPGLQMKAWIQPPIMGPMLQVGQAVFLLVNVNPSGIYEDTELYQTLQPTNGLSPFDVFVRSQTADISPPYVKVSLPPAQNSTVAFIVQPTTAGPITFEIGLLFRNEILFRTKKLIQELEVLPEERS
ncbi:hypothetical protein HYW11_02845 [Candidatus Peregrinibacteria bacterium]|nr:hypothetical protein [Candidatus Peregrinibacteria bacterium]